MTSADLQTQLLADIPNMEIEDNYRERRGEVYRVRAEEKELAGDLMRHEESSCVFCLEFCPVCVEVV